jgi:hypothetical protein
VGGPAAGDSVQQRGWTAPHTRKSHSSSSQLGTPQEPLRNDASPWGPLLDPLGASCREGPIAGGDALGGGMPATAPKRPGKARPMWCRCGEALAVDALCLPAATALAAFSGECESGDRASRPPASLLALRDALNRRWASRTKERRRVAFPPRDSRAESKNRSSRSGSLRLKGEEIRGGCVRDWRAVGRFSRCRRRGPEWQPFLARLRRGIKFEGQGQFRSACERGLPPGVAGDLVTGSYANCGQNR